MMDLRRLFSRLPHVASRRTAPAGKAPSPAGYAFTLIELMVVLLVMSLLIGIATWSFAEPAKRARARESLDRIQAFDESARHVARRFGRRVSMTFDLYNGTLERREFGQGGEPSFRITLPSGCRIDRIRVGGRTRYDGRTAISVTSLGISPTYAMRVVGPGLDRWVLVSGLTGEKTQLNDEREVDQLFSAMARSGDPTWTAAGSDAD